MDFIKLNFINAILKVSLITLGCTSPFVSSLTTGHSPSVTKSHYVNNVTIVMEDDVMRVNTADSNDSISKVEIYTMEDQKVLDIYGCFTNSCAVDISMLEANQYTVIINTVFGNPFSGTILIE